MRVTNAASVTKIFEEGVARSNEPRRRTKAMIEQILQQLISKWSQDKAPFHMMVPLTILIYFTATATGKYSWRGGAYFTGTLLRISYTLLFSATPQY